MMMRVMMPHMNMGQQQRQMGPAAAQAPAQPPTHPAYLLSELFCRANSSNNWGGQAVQPAATLAAWGFQHQVVPHKQREPAPAALAAAGEAQQSQGRCRSLFFRRLLWCRHLQQGLRPLSLKKSCRGGMQVRNLSSAGDRCEHVESNSVTRGDASAVAWLTQSVWAAA
jgi:hypothetical protein